MASREPRLKRQKILQQEPAGIGEHALWMELDAFDGKLPVAQAHDYAGPIGLGGAGAYLEIVRQALLSHYQRVIASGRQGTGSTMKDGLVIVFNAAYLAMHDFAGPDHTPAEGGADSLMAEAHTQDRFLSREILKQFNADAGLLRRTRPGRNHDVGRIAVFNFFAGNLIVTPHLNGFAQFAEILDQVVGKRIVIVEDEDHASENREISLAS